MEAVIVDLLELHRGLKECMDRLDRALGALRDRCPHHIQDGSESGLCGFYDSSPSRCSLETCPLRRRRMR